MSSTKADAAGAAQVGRALADALAGPETPGWERLPSARAAGHAGLLVRVGAHVFLVDFRPTAGPGAVAEAAKALRTAVSHHADGVVPVVATRFMTEAGRDACRRERVCWLDLSGNAELWAPGLRVRIDGKPNRFASRGRPASAFAPKSARLARWLLAHPGELPTQRELAQATGVSEGFVSRIVGTLLDEGYLERTTENRLHVKDRRLMLEAWRDAYEFGKHSVLAGHVAARSGEALIRMASPALAAYGLEHAATGLAAAWQYTRFASFRLASFYVSEPPPDALLASLGFDPRERGANLWLIVPDDLGVLQAARDVDGVRCVHPVQAWLDLPFHPERSKEAAEVLADRALELGGDE